MLTKCNADDYSHSYDKIEETFEALAKYDILISNISDYDFRSSFEGDGVGCKIYVFDIRYQNIFTATQPIKVELKLGGVVPDNVNGHELVLEKELVSLSSDGQRYLICLKFKIFIEETFIFIVNFVFFKNASLYFSGNLSIL